MHDHDLDLIAAYADGSLEQDSLEAERLVASCDVCREEYQRQREMKELLGSLPPVTLTDVERHRLHSELRRELTPPSPAVATPRRTRRAPWWTRVAVVAAGFLVVVVGAGVLVRMGNLVSAGGTESQLAIDEGTTAPAAETSLTTAAAMELAPQSEEGAVASPGADTEAATTTAASVGAAPDLGAVSLQGIEEALAAQAADTEGLVEKSRRVYEAVLSCVDRVDGDILAAATASVDGVPVEAYLVSHDGETEVVVLTVVDCSPLEG